MEKQPKHVLKGKEPKLLRLIVVDQDRAALDSLKRAFLPYKSQLDLQATTSGVESLLLVSEQRPDGFLIEAELPDIDGLEICRRVRARTQMARVRLIVMASKPSPELAEQSREAGALACLTKPVDTAQVLALLRAT